MQERSAEWSGGRSKERPYRGGLVGALLAAPRLILLLAGALASLIACAPPQTAPFAATASPPPKPSAAAVTATRPAAAPTTAPMAAPTAVPTREPSWTRAGLDGVALRALAIDPRQPATLYVGDGGLDKSTDAGKTWSPIRAVAKVRDIAVSPADPAVVYAGSIEGCLKGTTAPSFRSADGGKTWTAIGDNLTSYAPHPTRPDVVYAASCAGAVRSLDGGKSWQPLEGARPASYEVTQVALAPSAPDVLYVMSASEGGTVGLTKSEDSGKNWRTITPRDELWAPADLQVDPKNPNVAYAVTGKGVFRTADGGASWTAANAGLESARQTDGSLVSYPLAALAIDPARPEVLYLGTGGLRPTGAGIFRSWDGGKNWHALSDGLGTRPVRALTFAGGTVYAATLDGLWRLQW